MFRRLTAAACAAAAIAMIASTVVSADQPAGIMCSFKGKEFPIVAKGGNIGDAVQMCLDMGGHPSGAYKGKGSEGPTK